MWEKSLESLRANLRTKETAAGKLGSNLAVLVLLFKKLKAVQNLSPYHVKKLSRTFAGMSGTTNPILGNVGKIVGKFTRKFEN